MSAGHSNVDGMPSDNAFVLYEGKCEALDRFDALHDKAGGVGAQ